MISIDHAREKARERQRRWREEHGDDIADYQATHQEQRRAYQRRYYAENRAVACSRAFEYRHGISPSDYDRELTLQHNGCNECGATEPGEGYKYFLTWRYAGTIRLLCVECWRKEARVARDARSAKETK